MLCLDWNKRKSFRLAQTSAEEMGKTYKLHLEKKIVSEQGCSENLLTLFVS